MGGRNKQARKADKEAGLVTAMVIPCKKGHNHVWPTAGPITKEDVGRCQVVCQFCSLDGIYNEAKWPWHLRRHIYDVHRHSHPELEVPPEWSGKKQYSKGKTGPTPKPKQAEFAGRAAKPASAAPMCCIPTPEQAARVEIDLTGDDIGLDTTITAPVGEAALTDDEILAAVLMDCNKSMEQPMNPVTGLTGDEYDFDGPLTFPAGEYALAAQDNTAAAPLSYDQALEQSTGSESGFVGGNVDFSLLPAAPAGESDLSVSSSPPAPMFFEEEFMQFTAGIENDPFKLGGADVMLSAGFGFDFDSYAS